MDTQYGEMTALAFVWNTVNPSPESEAFITSLNKLIDDTNAAYNQRMGQLKKKNE